MYFVYFISGCIWGSFLCLVAERVPKRQSIIQPRSHCIFCKKKLGFLELIPLFSIILLRFRCLHCQTKLPIIYFGSELVSGLLFTAVLPKGLSLQTFYQLVLLLMMFLLSLTDIYYLQVEPKFFYPLFSILCLIHFYLGKPFYLLPAFLVFITLILFNNILRDSIGGGDILLISALSLLLDSELLLRLLLFASSSGLLYLLFSTFLLKKKIYPLPFVPFLGLGLFFVLFF